MNDLVINRDSGGAIHLNKNKKMNNASKELLNKSAVETPVPLHKQLVPWAQMNTSKEHFRRLMQVLYHKMPKIYLKIRF